MSKGFVPVKDKQAFKAKFFGSLDSSPDDIIPSKSSQRSNKSSAGGSSVRLGSLKGRSSDSQGSFVSGGGTNIGSDGSSKESQSDSPEAKPVKKLTLKSPDVHKYPEKGIRKNPFEKKSQDAGEMKRKIFGSCTSESETPETPSPRPDKKKKKSSPSFDECIIDHKKKGEMDNVTVRKPKDRTPKKEESPDHNKDDNHDCIDGLDSDEDMFAGCDVSIVNSYPSQKSNTSPVLPTKSSSRFKSESRNESKKSTRGPLDAFVKRTSSISNLSIDDEALAADILADDDDDERFRRDPHSPSSDIFKTSQSQDMSKSRETSPIKSRSSLSSPIVQKKVLDSPRSDSEDSLGSFASKSPSPKVRRYISSSQESNSSAKKKGKSSKSSATIKGIKEISSSVKGKREKNSSYSGGIREKSSSVEEGIREKSSSEIKEINSQHLSFGLRKKVKSSQNGKLFNCFGSDDESESTSTKKEKAPLVESKRIKEKDKAPFVDLKRIKEKDKALVESKKTSDKDKEYVKSKSSKSSSASKDEKDHKRLKDKNSSSSDRKQDKKNQEVLDAYKKDKTKKEPKAESSSKTKKAFFESSEDEEKKENQLKKFKIPKLERKDSDKGTSASDKKPGGDKSGDSKRGYSNSSSSSSKAQSSRAGPSSFFGSSGSKKSEPASSTSTFKYKFFKKEDVSVEGEEVAYKLINDKNNKKTLVKVDPSQIKHRKNGKHPTLGPAGQAVLDYAYGVHEPRKSIKWTPPKDPELDSTASSDSEEESTSQDEDDKSKKSSKKSPKKKKQKNILSYMTVRSDMDEIRELLEMKIPRPDLNDGVDISAMLKKDNDARQAQEKIDREYREERRRKRDAEEKYEDENAALRDRLEAELTHEKIEEYFKDFHPICEEIKAGDAEWCWRHTQFYKDTNARQGLLYRQILDPFTSDQVETANGHLMKIYMRDRTEWFANNHYCDNVLLPEFLVYMYMNMFSLEREEAASRIKHTPLKPEDDHLGVFQREPEFELTCKPLIL